MSLKQQLGCLSPRQSAALGGRVQNVGPPSFLSPSSPSFQKYRNSCVLYKEFLAVSLCRAIKTKFFKNLEFRKKGYEHWPRRVLQPKSQTIQALHSLPKKSGRLVTQTDTRRPLDTVPSPAAAYQPRERGSFRPHAGAPPGPPGLIITLHTPSCVLTAPLSFPYWTVLFLRAGTLFYSSLHE